MSIPGRSGIDSVRALVRASFVSYVLRLVSGPPTIEIFRMVQDSERFAAGDVIFAKGSIGDRMYVVREGTVTIEAEGQPLEAIGPGGIFGELALIDASTRSATATATSDCDLVPLDERAFLFHVSQTPFFALSVMRVLADRLRRATAPQAEPAAEHALRD
jgi:CRP/FNR family transcriptional regulator, cyclic AMP receptor protein